MSQTPSPLSIHADLPAEQAFLAHAYDCLAFIRERAVALKNLGYLGGNVHACAPMQDVVAEWDLDKQRRIDALDNPESALCFGRIDRSDDAPCYVGRRHVEDRDGNPVLTDWRASRAEPFYRATVADPMGLARRRRFVVEDRELLDIFDEDLEHPGDRDTGAYVPDPLLVEIGRSRTGSIRDIVATIQAEQDVIIRAPLGECIIVQGGPGTGKTTVGLHRAAYLLYQHRDQLERERLLIVGPNRIFLTYVAQVLPSLGETAAVQLTLEGLAGIRFRVGLVEQPAVARLKGDARLAEVLRHAVRDHVRPPTSELAVVTPFGRVVFSSAAVDDIVVAQLERVRRMNDGRTAFRERVLELGWNFHRARTGAGIAEHASVEGALRSNPDLKRWIDRVWPSLSAAGVVQRLLSNRTALASASDGLLSPEEQSLLLRPSQSGQQRWSRADLALLDEAEDLVNGLPSGFGHIVVDEAQDLSAMELRMIERRSRSGSMTILGDLAQATSPGAQADWSDALRELGRGRGRVEELTVGYRVPAPILQFANRLLPHIAPDVTPAISARSAGDAPKIFRVAPGDVGATTGSVVARLAEMWSTTGVIVPASLREEVRSAIEERGLDIVDGDVRAALGDHVTLLSPGTAKGLEFDAVLAVEPSRIVSEDPGGLRTLYVVLTRAVQELAIVHSAPFPIELTDAAGAARSRPGLSS